MPGYDVKFEHIAVAGAAGLQIRSLLDRQQFADADGAAQALGISSAQWPLFGLLWPSGLQLARHMAGRTAVHGERILEIGCGLALASLVCHRRGQDITASDCHPLTDAFLRENLRLNSLPPLPYRHGQWGEMTAAGQARAPVQGQFDLIIGSDVLYERDDGGTLAGYIDRHALPAAQVLIVDPDRGNRSAFSRRMAGLGFGLQELRLDEAATLADDAGLGALPAYKGRLLHYQRAGAAAQPNRPAGAP